MEYLVIFLDIDGKELYRTMVAEGDTAIYEGEIPKRENEQFVGWNKSLKNITESTIVTAVYEKVKKGNLKLGAISFVENEKSVHIIDQTVVTNKDLVKTQDKETSGKDL